MRRAREDQANDYMRTTMSNVDVQKEHDRHKQMTEEIIKNLEAEESRML